MEIGLGLIRKMLSIATGGLSGLLFKDDSKKKRTAKAAPKKASSGQPKTTAGKPQKARRAKPRAARAPSGTAAELERLTKLREQGALTTEEFAAAKAKILGTSIAPAGPSLTPEGQGRPAYEAVEANVAASRQIADLADRGRSPSLATRNGD
jgi:Short C-terminal domain